jgi:hypothetical protein
MAWHGSKDSKDSELGALASRISEKERPPCNRRKSPLSNEYPSIPKPRALGLCRGKNIAVCDFSVGRLLAFGYFAKLILFNIKRMRKIKLF